MSNICLIDVGVGNGLGTALHPRVIVRSNDAFADAIVVIAGPGPSVAGRSVEAKSVGHWFLARAPDPSSTGGSATGSTAARAAYEAPRIRRWPLPLAADAYGLRGVHGETRTIIMKGALLPFRRTVIRGQERGAVG
jgi:hypothetical protein